MQAVLLQQRVNPKSHCLGKGGGTAIEVCQPDLDLWESATNGRDDLKLFTVEPVEAEQQNGNTAAQSTLHPDQLSDRGIWVIDFSYRQPARFKRHNGLTASLASA